MSAILPMLFQNSKIPQLSIYPNKRQIILSQTQIKHRITAYIHNLHTGTHYWDAWFFDPICRRLVGVTATFYNVPIICPLTKLNTPQILDKWKFVG